MPLIPNHNLDNEFPESIELIQQLKRDDPQFAQMASEYHALDHKVRGLEMCDIPTSDENYEDLKKRRLYLKDQLYSVIRHTQKNIQLEDTQ